MDNLVLKNVVGRYLGINTRGKVNTRILIQLETGEYVDGKISNVVRDSLKLETEEKLGTEITVDLTLANKPALSDRVRKILNHPLKDDLNPVTPTETDGRLADNGDSTPTEPVVPPNTNTDDDDGNPTPPADAKPRKPVQLSVPARNPKNVQKVKDACGNKCQVCNKVVELDYHGKYYSECHHVVPLSYADKPTAFEGKFENIKGDLDVIQNMICVCPNCHAKLHYGTDELNVDLEKHKQHPIKKEYIEYYNTLILPDNMTRYTRDTTTQDKYDPFDAVVVDEIISNMESP
jgi:hypothetical protein